MSLCHTVNNVINGRKENCCLCFKTIEKNGFHLQDEIICDSEDNSQDILEMLSYILGDEVSNVIIKSYIHLYVM